MTKRLIRRLWSHPDLATDKEMTREMLRLMRWRIAGGVASLGGWTWLRLTVLREVPYVGRLTDLILVAIVTVVFYPIFRIATMDEDEWDEALAEAFPEGVPEPGMVIGPPPS